MSDRFKFEKDKNKEINNSPYNSYKINQQDLESPKLNSNETKIFLKKLAQENEENNLRSLISTSRTQLEKIGQKFNSNNSLKANKNNPKLDPMSSINPNINTNDYFEKEYEIKNYKSDYNIINEHQENIFRNNIYNNPNKNLNEKEKENSVNYPISAEIRISNLEKRIENIEKILHFYDELFRLKNEEKVNEERIDKNKLTEISKKLNFLEENYKFANMKFKDNFNVDKKMENLEKKLTKFLENKNSISEYYATKLSEFEDIYKKTQSFLENKLDERLISMQNNYDGKLEDVVNLINEFTKQLDKNEFSLVENREGIRNIQMDHIDFLKIVTILKEKADSMDYLMDQITDLKFKYNKILNIYGIQGNSQEEDQIVKNITHMNINENNN